MDTGKKPRPEAGSAAPSREQSPLTGWATVAALALTGLAVLGGLWLLGRHRAAQPRPKAENLRLLLDINTASAEELRLLPGIGSGRAARIITVREARGGFRSLKELEEPTLLGPGAAERLAPYVHPLPGDG